MAEPALFVGSREADPARRPIEGSQPKPCCACGAHTMFSPALLARAAEHPSVRFACLECATERQLIDGLVILPASSAQVRELSGAGHEGFALQELWGRKAVRRG